MSINIQIRKAGPYIADGRQTAFSFSFKVFAASDVLVYTALADSYKDEAEQVDPSLFSVSLNAGQDSAPGGTVTFSTPPASGTPVTIISGIPATQPMQLTNRGGFFPETLNDSADRAVALIQQLSEKVERAVKVPVTSTGSPEELTQKLLDAADDATVVAKGYAEQARASAEESAASASAAAASEASAAEQVGRVTEEADSQIERVVSETDDQVKRIENAADGTLTNLGFSCAEEVWTAESAVESGGEMTLPNGLTYIIGRKHLRMNWNGVELQRGVNFEEVGDRDHVGRKVRVLFPVSAGDELMAWTVALGHGVTDELLPLIQANSDALADLSSKVVYKSEAGESGGSTSE